MRASAGRAGERRRAERARLSLPRLSVQETRDGRFHVVDLDRPTEMEGHTYHAIAGHICGYGDANSAWGALEELRRRALAHAEAARASDKGASDMHITEARRLMAEAGWELRFERGRERTASGFLGKAGSYAWACRRGGSERVKLAAESRFCQWSMARLAQAIAELPTDEADRAAAEEGLPPDAGTGHYLEAKGDLDGDDDGRREGTPTDR